jgi:hypothetical protein
VTDVQVAFYPATARRHLPAETLAHIDQLTQELAELGPDWLLQAFWGDRRDGINQITAEPATTKEHA